MIQKPDITNIELQRYILGPDFPTGMFLCLRMPLRARCFASNPVLAAALAGGTIGVGQGLADAYQTGSGSVLLRAKVRCMLSSPRGARGLLQA